jgi:hypothetical protein
MEINDELARAIGFRLAFIYKGGGEAEFLILGRAALEACRDIILDEVLAEPSERELEASVVNDEFGGHDGCVRRAFANRLKSLTQPPSKREQVEAVLKGRGDSIEAMLDKIDAIYKESE